MSTVPDQTGSSLIPEADDPYFYGFRQRCRRRPDGKMRLVTTPLTEDDVLHPREGDHITQNTPHQEDCIYLSDVIDLRLAGVAGAVRLTDCRVNLGLPGVRSVGPDVTVCRNVRSAGPWNTFSVTRERAEIALIIEITSPATRNNDLNDKSNLYWRAGVHCYVIVDQVSVRDGARQLRILAFERGRRTWRRMRLRSGRVWLEVVGLWLGVRDGRIVCWDAEERELLRYSEALPAVEEVRAAAEEARAAAEEARAAAEEARTAAEERIRQLEAEVRRLRSEK